MIDFFNLNTSNGNATNRASNSFLYSSSRLHTGHAARNRSDLNCVTYPAYSLRGSPRLGKGFFSGGRQHRTIMRPCSDCLSASAFSRGGAATTVLLTTVYGRDRLASSLAGRRACRSPSSKTVFKRGRLAAISRLIATTFMASVRSN